MVKSVNIRALKDRLSAYLRDVQKGDVVLVTDRGQVVAELRQPTLHGLAMDVTQQRRQQLVEQGVLRPGLPRDASVYRVTGRLRLTADVVDAALDWTRGSDAPDER